MNISDLQYIESVDTSEVQGAGSKKDYSKKHYPKYKVKSAKAYAEGYALAYGDKSDAYSKTYSFADPDFGVSEAYSVSSAKASSKYYH